MRKLIIGLSVAAMAVGITLGVTVPPANSWDGLCGTDANPVPCICQDTGVPSDAPCTPPVVTEPQPTPAPVPTTPELTPPAAPVEVPTAPEPVVTPGQPVKSKVPSPVTCSWLRKVKAGKNRLYKYRCIVPPKVHKNRGPFNPKVAGEVSLLSRAFSWAKATAIAAGDTPGWSTDYHSPGVAGVLLHGSRVGHRRPNYVKGQHLTCTTTGSLHCGANFVLDGKTYSIGYNVISEAVPGSGKTYLATAEVRK